MQVVKNHCREIGAKLDDISLEVEFLKDEITLDFPEGMSKKGWEITPMFRPVVSTLGIHLLLVVTTKKGSVLYSSISYIDYQKESRHVRERAVDSSVSADDGVEGGRDTSTTGVQDCL